MLHSSTQANISVGMRHLKYLVSHPTASCTSSQCLADFGLDSRPVSPPGHYKIDVGILFNPTWVTQPGCDGTEDV